MVGSQAYAFSSSQDQDILFSKLEKGKFNPRISKSKLREMPAAFYATSSSYHKIGGSPSLTFNNWQNGEISIIYAFHNSTSDILDREAPWVESLISRAFIQIGDKFMELVQTMFGTDLSIDNIIFNKYKPIIVDFFSSVGVGKYYPIMRLVINNWFKVLRSFTIVVLIIVLVAMGIKIMFISHTGDTKKITNMLVGWILAVLMLFVGPYFMKYAIEMNDVLVSLFEKNRQYALFSIYNYDLSDLDLVTVDVNDYNNINPANTAGSSNSNDYQIGEDSETTFLDKLIAIKSDLEENYAKNQTYQDATKDDLTRIRNDVMAYSVKITTKNNIIINSTTQAFREIEKAIDSGMSSREATQFVVNRIEVKSGGIDVEDPVYVAYELQSLYRDYSEAYEKSLKIAGDIDKVEQTIAIVEKNMDLMGTMRTRAGKTHRFVFVLVWFVLIFQLILLLVLYYKRLLTIAVLIVVFPLVMLFYAIEKLMGVEKPKVLRSWITEYMVNVFIQSVHALLYIILIDTGLAIYEADADNWLFFVFAVTAIFPMESIIKSIMGMKASTVKDLKESAKKSLLYGGAAMAIAKAGGSKKKDEIEKRGARAEARVDRNRERRDKKITAYRQIRDDFIAHHSGSAEKAFTRLGKARDFSEKFENAKNDFRKTRTDIRRGARKLKRPLQRVRNAQAKVGGITSGLAAGGTAEGFIQGAAISGIMAGSTRPNISTNAKLSSDTSSKSTAQLSNFANSSFMPTGSRNTGESANRYENAGPGATASQASNASAANSKNANGNNQTPRTTKSEAKSQRKARRDANRTRARVAKGIAQNQVNKNQNYRLNFHNSEE